MSKKRDLFPFRGEMVSAYQIAKAYGIGTHASMIKKRLLEGMSIEEAVEDVSRTKTYKWHDTGDSTRGISRWEIEKLRKSVKIDNELRVQIGSSNKADIEPAIRRETCRVTGTYPYLVTLRRPCGLITSKTYVDLIMEGMENGDYAQH